MESRSLVRFLSVIITGVLTLGLVVGSMFLAQIDPNAIPAYLRLIELSEASDDAEKVTNRRPRRAGTRGELGLETGLGRPQCQSHEGSPNDGRHDDGGAGNDGRIRRV